MGLQKVYGIDSGCGNFKFYSQFKNNIYMEKNMIAVRKDRKVIAVGDNAYEMYEKTPSNIQVASPMSAGLIADVPRMEFILYHLINKNDRIPFWGGAFYFAIPMNLSHLEQRTYDTVTNGGRMHNNRVFMVEKPIADAIALDISVEKTKGSMIVNIGDQSTELSILSAGKVIINKTLPIGGMQMNQAICEGIRKNYKLQIGNRTANRLKLVMGNLGGKTIEARKVYGIDSLSGLPREEIITAQIIQEALIKQITAI
ncbi:MAG: rod shape-determining protein, partial [Lachnospiraceae bacterium]|nr:rod shape-determining protein [Lachnospiraceae bacterium]